MKNAWNLLIKVCLGANHFPSIWSWLPRFWNCLEEKKEEKKKQQASAYGAVLFFALGVWVISQSIWINGANYSDYQFRLKLSEVKSMNTYAVERERSKTFHKATKNYFGIPIKCLGYYWTQSDRFWLRTSVKNTSVVWSVLLQQGSRNSWRINCPGATDR